MIFYITAGQTAKYIQQAFIANKKRLYEKRQGRCTWLHYVQTRC